MPTLHSLCEQFIRGQVPFSILDNALINHDKEDKKSMLSPVEHAQSFTIDKSKEKIRHLYIQIIMRLELIKSGIVSESLSSSYRDHIAMLQIAQMLSDTKDTFVNGDNDTDDIKAFAIHISKRYNSSSSSFLVKETLDALLPSDIIEKKPKRNKTTTIVKRQKVAPNASIAPESKRVNSKQLFRREVVTSKRAPQRGDSLSKIVSSSSTKLQSTKRTDVISTKKTDAISTRRTTPPPRSPIRKKSSTTKRETSTVFVMATPKKQKLQHAMEDVVPDTPRRK